MQTSDALKLRWQIRRGIQQEPGLVIGTDGDRRLCARRNPCGAGSCLPAIRTIAVPLGQPTAGRRAQEYDPHGTSLAVSTEREHKNCADAVPRTPWHAFQPMGCKATNYRV